MNTTESTHSQPIHLTGRVKWFNNKSGFGFITVSDEGQYKNKDIFVHYSSISVDSTKYKYMVQGEYVEFNLVKSGNDKHEFHALDITGIKGGMLMCETHCANSNNGQSTRTIKTVNKDRESV